MLKFSFVHKSNRYCPQTYTSKSLDFLVEEQLSQTKNFLYNQFGVCDFQHSRYLGSL